jgi:hypothetical protein
MSDRGAGGKGRPPAGGMQYDARRQWCAKAAVSECARATE